MQSRRLFAALALMCACSGGATAPSVSAPPSGFGVYTLRTVADKPLPIVYSNGLTYVRGSIELRADSSFTDVFVVSYSGGGYSDTLRGRFSDRGDSLLFASQSRPPYTMKLNGNATLTGRWAEGEFVYRK